MRTLTAVVATAVAAPFVAVAVTAAPAAAGPPASGEFRVNTYTTGNQFSPAVATDAGGNSVVVWTSDGQDGDNYGIYAQRYDVDGKPRGSEFRVNLTTTGVQYEPDVAMDAAGDMVVTWTSFAHGSGAGVFLRRFPARGTPAGEVRVNSYTTSNQEASAVAMDAAGNFAVTWQSDGQDGDAQGVYVRRYAADGSSLGAAALVNQTTSGVQWFPDVAMSATGAFVVTWNGNGGAGLGIYSQLFSSNGARVKNETRVDSGAASTAIRNEAVAMDADGDYAVTWETYGQDGDAEGVYVQRFTSGGAAVGPETRANSVGNGSQFSPAVAMAAGGDYLVTWTSTPQDGDGFGVYSRRYSSTGTPLTAELRVNSTTTGDQGFPAVALDADGDAFLAWDDGTAYWGPWEVSGRRFRGTHPVDLRLTQTDDADPLPVTGRVTYRMKVANLEEPSADTGIPAIDDAIGAATGVRVDSTVPDGATYISSAGTGWTCTPSAATVRCAYAGGLDAGEVAPRLSVAYDLSEEAGTTQHAARVYENQLDAVPTDNGEVEATQTLCFLYVGSTAVTTVESGIVTVPVNRVGTNCGTTGVSYDTVDGTARSDSDYDATSGVLVMDEATSSKSIDVPVAADVLDERNETFGVRLTDPSGALLGPPSRSTVTITDDDAPPRINFTTAAGTGAEPGALVDVTVRLSAVSGVPVTVTLAKSGTATSGADYFAPTKITIPPGERSADFTVEVADDALAEGGETATLTLAAPVNVVLGSLKTYQLTITSNE